MDFYKIKERSTKNGVTEVYPDFKVTRSRDLMVRAREFYAIWDEETGLWSTDEYDVQRLVDKDLHEYKERTGHHNEGHMQLKLMGDFSSNSWRSFRSYLGHVSNNYHPLDTELTFSNTVVKKEDYVSRRLPYPLERGDAPAYDEIISTLYDPQEREKLEWAVGAIIAGDAKDIQKFIVLYGAPGSGKGTFINIILRLFEGYYTSFEAKALTASSNQFATEVFKSNPLVAIQHDGDLSRIEDNTKLNSIVSHEEIVINEKNKPTYMARINSFLFMGTNKPVKITDAKSGIIRRLIDVHPSGRRIPAKKYHSLMAQIEFELGAIAHHCLDVYREMGKDFYAGYRPVEMMLHTDVFYNFIESGYFVFKEQDGATLAQAYEMYKEYCEDSLVDFKLPRYKFREELKNYFSEFHERYRLDGEQVRSYYSGFMHDKFTTVNPEPEILNSVVMDHKVSLLDDILADSPAQLANQYETPSRKWKDVTTTLKDLDTSELHYVKPPENHIVIDFDLKGDDGEKSLELNLEAASLWPATYGELSKGGSGLHLHYYWRGDDPVADLSRVYSDGIEIKVFTGDSSLRRRLSRCNNVPIAEINSGIPLKEKKVINFDTVMSEMGLRDLIIRNLNKEIHPATKPSVDFIHKILEDAYESGISYDVTDMRGRILAFANNSSNQALTCIKLVNDMKFASDEMERPATVDTTPKLLAFFDVEVFPNLFIVSWKWEGQDSRVTRMINPTPQEIENILKLPLVGFNCRRYDNHILYARYMGYDIEQLYKLSQRIISNDRSAYFGEAYNLSYADIYDYASKKQSLKVWQIELGLVHKELGLPWDQPVPEEMWDKVGEYCDNDVITTEQVHVARRGDFIARQILADLSGLTVNDTGNRHSARIIFGQDKNHQSQFEYTDLSERFVGYEHEFGKSSYRGEDPSEGGYVYAEPGMYTDVAVLDVASMHPTSIIELNLFGDKYTKKFKELVDARIAIKHRDFDEARKMMDGKLAPHLSDESAADMLSYALKIVINSVYGLTSAKFDNPFRDIRNKDNIVAKRGALFMIDLKNFVQSHGFPVVHIKTDSIKIPNATPEIIEEVVIFGAKYGYDFEHEMTYSKFCLVNDAVFVGKVGWAEKESLIGHWEAVGAQFIHPYVYNTLFANVDIQFEDVCETKSVTTALYLDVNGEKRFIGRAGSFIPVIEGVGGGRLLREKDGEYHSATGAKGYLWMESSDVEFLDKDWTEIIDMSYYTKLVDSAVDKISQFGDFEWLTAA